MSRDFTKVGLRENNNAPKTLNRCDFLLPGTLLAATRGQKIRMAQPRVRSINESVSSTFRRRIRSLESIHEGDASRHSPGAIEQPQGDCRNRRMEKAAGRRLAISHCRLALQCRQITRGPSNAKRLVSAQAPGQNVVARPAPNQPVAVHPDGMSCDVNRPVMPLIFTCNSRMFRLP